MLDDFRADLSHIFAVFDTGERVGQNRLFVVNSRRAENIRFQKVGYKVGGKLAAENEPFPGFL